MPCGCTDKNLINNKNLNKKFNIDAISNLSIDSIIELYREGYRLETTTANITNTTINANTIIDTNDIDVLSYSSQCSGGTNLDSGNNNTSVLAGTWGTVQRGRVWAQRFYANYRCLDSVQFNGQREASVNFYIEIRKDVSGLPQGVPLVNDSGLILRTTSISYSEIPTSPGWFYPTVGALLPSTGTYYWICFVPTDFYDSPNYRSPTCIGDPSCDRFLLQDGTNLTDKRTAEYAGGSWTTSNSYAFAVYYNPTFTEVCSTLSNVNANPTTALVGDLITLGTQANPAGAYTVQFVDQTTNTVLASVPSSTSTSTYSTTWTPSTAGVYQIIARVVGQCSSSAATTVTINCTPSVSGVTASPDSGQVGQSITLTSMVTPAGIYTVQFLDQNNNVVASKTSSTSTSTYSTTWTPTAVGTYQLRAKTSTQANSCANQPPETVTINPSCSTVTATPTTAIVGNPVSLSMTVSPAGAYTVQFLDQNNNVLVSVTSSSSISTYSTTWTPTTTGTYQIKGSISGQCTSSSATTVTVNPACSTMSDVTPNPSTVIVNNSVTLSATLSPSGIFTVEFFNADNPTQVFATDVATTSKTTYSQTWTPTSTGTFHIKARVGAQCSSTNPATVTVNPATVSCSTMSDVTPNPTTVTVNNSVTLSVTVSPSGIYTVEFFDSDNPTNVFVSKTETTATTSYSQTWTPTSTGTFHIKARVGTQCTSTNSATVTVNSATGVTCASITTPLATPSTFTEGGYTTLRSIVTPSTTTTQEFSVQFMEGNTPIGTSVTTVNHLATKIWTPSTGTHYISSRVGSECVSPGTTKIVVNAPSQAGFGGAGMIVIAGIAIGALFVASRSKLSKPKEFKEIKKTR